MTFNIKDHQAKSYQGVLKIDHTSMPKKEAVNYVLQGEHELILTWTALREIEIKPFIHERGYEGIKIKLKKKE